MKYIQLTQNKQALVDDIDYDYLNQFKWCYHCGYATRGRPTIRMHRIIAKQAGMDCSETIDHINMNPLDNRRKNLRPAAQAQQKMNSSAPKNNTSGFKGVSYRKDRDKWRVYITYKRHRYYLGLFTDKLKAAKAYNKAAKKFFGEFARLNKV